MPGIYQRLNRCWFLFFRLPCPSRYCLTPLRLRMLSSEWGPNLLKGRECFWCFSFTLEYIACNRHTNSTNNWHLLHARYYECASNDQEIVPAFRWLVSLPHPPIRISIHWWRKPSIFCSLLCSQRMVVRGMARDPMRHIWKTCGL